MNKAFLHLAAMVVLSVALLSTEVPNGECFNAMASVVRSNASGIAKEFWIDDEEFWMESETSRRILQAGKTPPTLKVLDRTKTQCDANSYGKCDPMLNKNYKQRNCGYKNTCNKPGN